jgi:hypothetical protein
MADEGVTGDVAITHFLEEIIKHSWREPATRMMG